MPSASVRPPSGRHPEDARDLRDHGCQRIGSPSVGVLVLGKLSGRHGFKARLDALGYELTSEEFARAFADFKRLADRKR